MIQFFFFLFFNFVLDGFFGIKRSFFSLLSLRLQFAYTVAYPEFVP